MKIKALLYCTKAKPYLYFAQESRTLMDIDNSFEGYKTTNKNVDEYLNGKIVAECDYEVEEIENKLTNNNSHLELFTGSLTEEELFENSCLSRYEMFNYLKNDFSKVGEPKGRAILVKDLHIFDKPKELSDYYNILASPS